jgi:hypothetical protein
MAHASSIKASLSNSAAIADNDLPMAAVWHLLKCCVIPLTTRVQNAYLHRLAPTKKIQYRVVCQPECKRQHNGVHGERISKTGYNVNNLTNAVLFTGLTASADRTGGGKHRQKQVR